MGELVLRNVEKSYEEGPKIIHGVNLAVPDGQFTVFVGPSGCGKSTMLRMIAGLETVTAGEILIDGRRVNDVPPANRGISMVFQNYALYPHMTVAENMSFSLKLAGATKGEINDAVGRAAEILQISHLLERKPKALSGGQRQRVAIGRAIVRKPRIFLFDEPLSNLDAALRVQMRLELARLHRELGTTMIYVTHDQVEAMTLGDQIVVFNKGNIEQVGAPLDLYHRPANRFVGAFLGSPQMNFLGAAVVSQNSSATVVELDGGAGRLMFPGVAGASLARECALGIRPENISLVPEGEGWRAIVEAIEHLGDVSIIYARLPGTAKPIGIKVAKKDLRLAIGQTIAVHAEAGNTVLFDASGRAVTFNENFVIAA
ncbi:sn-glycerol-3-phosphate ABC transporter ATP-binding protein UgpC [Burkholderia pyrrocinia]|uniref:ABC transporter ATP-binding protein n=1 Tax=Burkholderia pyrrocinia TaxID=60550 RepID=UPI002AB0189C|nr:sn-glycerol-3-phosphate ABC transporter ATP-binding protein UgpC [Burkholderia pyrrocinia]